MPRPITFSHLVLAQAADRTNNTQVYCIITTFIDIHSRHLYTYSYECQDAIKYCEYFTEVQSRAICLRSEYSGLSVTVSERQTDRRYISLDDE